MNKNISYISELNHDKHSWKIKVKVIRRWYYKVSFKASIRHLQMIVMDEKVFYYDTELCYVIIIHIFYIS